VSEPAEARGREGQTFGGTSRLVRYANFVKLPHTLFALPFALVGVTIASYVKRVTLADIAWVAVAFTAARFAAMGFNRIADRNIDALNPRTAARELPSGAMSVREASLAVLCASAIFIAAAWMLNPLCFALSPIAPVGGYHAVTGAWRRPWWVLMALAAAVMSWGGGFDIFYALQDIDFDRAQGLHSLPARHGTAPAIAIARGLHLGTIAMLALAGLGIGAGAFYWAGVCVVALLLIYEHSLVHPADLSRLDAAFFTMNGVLSVTFFAFVLVGRVLAR
jgi:4-hydroxybenzoate polyprenyltransferase